MNMFYTEIFNYTFNHVLYKESKTFDVAPSTFLEVLNL